MFDWLVFVCQRERQAKQLKLADISKAGHVGLTTVTNFEARRVSSATPKIVTGYAKALGIPEVDLWTAAVSHYRLGA
jgi:transcriptional regulator with XRE-family HTH domain